VSQSAKDSRSSEIHEQRYQESAKAPSAPRSSIFSRREQRPRALDSKRRQPCRERKADCYDEDSLRKQLHIDEHEA